MKRLNNHTVGVEDGEVILFSDYEDGGEMWTGRGQRERRRHIRFSQAFVTEPTVHLSLSMWDVDAATVARVDLQRDAVTAEGFDIVFRTWGDTRVARVRVSWMAIGSLPGDDDWALV